MSEPERYQVTSLEEGQQAIDAVMARARRYVDILSPALEPRLYDRDSCHDALRRVATSGGRAAHVRILIRDGATLVDQGNRLVELARRLTTTITLHRLSPHDADDTQAFVIVDGRACIDWQGASGYEALVEPDSRLYARRLHKRFLRRWERSEPDPELRRLYL